MNIIFCWDISNRSMEPDSIFCDHSSHTSGKLTAVPSWLHHASVSSPSSTKSVYTIRNIKFNSQTWSLFLDCHKRHTFRMIFRNYPRSFPDIINVKLKKVCSRCNHSMLVIISWSYLLSIHCLNKSCVFSGQWLILRIIS